jgi:hypothetical protein
VRGVSALAWVIRVPSTSDTSAEILVISSRRG